jgi:hypothetical protein
MNWIGLKDGIRKKKEDLVRSSLRCFLQYVADRQGFGVKKNEEAHKDAGEHRPREPAALHDETEETKKEGLGKRGESKTMTTTMGVSVLW